MQRDSVCRRKDVGVRSHTMATMVNVNGRVYDEQHALISVFDHGLLYGDGVFEGIRAYHGRVFKLAEHIERLFCSAKAILLKMPLTPEQVEAELGPSGFRVVARHTFLPRQYFLVLQASDR